MTCPAGKEGEKVTCPKGKSTCPGRPDGFFFRALPNGAWRQAKRPSYNKKMLTRQVIPLALGYGTALSSRPDLTPFFEQINISPMATAITVDCIHIYKLSQ